MSSDSWKPRCPYLSTIGQKYIQCNLCFKITRRKEFNTYQETLNFASLYCLNNFDKCLSYHELYNFECTSIDEWISTYKKCAYCCNNSGYTGLQNNCGSTHGFCQMHKKEVAKYDPLLVCEWFNKKPNSNINNILDILNSYIT